MLIEWLKHTRVAEPPLLDGHLEYIQPPAAIDVTYTTFSSRSDRPRQTDIVQPRCSSVQLKRTDINHESGSSQRGDGAAAERA